MASEGMTIQQKILVSFCVTVLLAVIIFGAYLSGRTTQAATLIDVPPPPKITESKPISRRLAEAAVRPIAGRTYLQMAAVDRAGADAIAQELLEKGFRVAIGDGPTTDLLRVLVGPLDDAAAVSLTKAELETQGFASFPRKY